MVPWRARHSWAYGVYQHWPILTLTPQHTVLQAAGEDGAGAPDLAHIRTQAPGEDGGGDNAGSSGSGRGMRPEPKASPRGAARQETSSLRSMSDTRKAKFRKLLDEQVQNFISVCQSHAQQPDERALYQLWCMFQSSDAAYKRRLASVPFGVQVPQLDGCRRKRPVRREVLKVPALPGRGPRGAARTGLERHPGGAAAGVLAAAAGLSSAQPRAQVRWVVSARPCVTAMTATAYGVLWQQPLGF